MVDQLPDETKAILKNGVLIHIERAELHFNQARLKKDDQYYTDTIYRTNQAFEGILKEAYRVLAKKDPSKIRPYDIENYFEDNNIFNKRVKNAFTSYRQDWRNPATHDYTLFFKNNEAFLAILNVSAFIYILLNQIAETLAYEKTKEQIKEMEIDKELHKDKTTVENLLNSIKIFNVFANKTQQPKTEHDIVGMLKAYLETINNELEIITDYIDETKGLRPDIVIKQKNEIILIIEVKYDYSKLKEQNGKQQLYEYMNSLKSKTGVLFIYSSAAIENEMYFEESLFGEEKYYFIVPKKKI